MRNTSRDASGDAQLSLRTVADSDDRFLRALFAEERALELAHMDWTRPQKEAFIQQQYQAQKADYTARFPDADHQIVMLGEKPAGRLWVAYEEDHVRLLDFSLLNECKSRGVETEVVQLLQQRGRKMQKPVRVNLPHSYRAFRALLVQMGFRCVLCQHERDLMEWRPQDASGLVVAKSIEGETTP